VRKACANKASVVVVENPPEKMSRIEIDDHVLTNSGERTHDLGNAFVTLHDIVTKTTSAPPMDNGE
jgi:hypothetical protein